MATNGSPLVLMLSNNGVADGFGRIADSVATRLLQRGYRIHAGSFAYDGLLPTGLPYHISPIGNDPSQWLPKAKQLISVIDPDIVLVIQDAPYAERIFSQAIDWSQRKFAVITPVDGIPLHPAWVDTIKQADAALTISEYGVDAFREAGVAVGLCRPAVDLNEFRPPVNREEFVALRKALGLSPSSFVLGTMAANQGRKQLPLMIEAFFEFAKDKPDARYMLDTEPVSIGGWDIPALCEQHGWDIGKLILKNAPAMQTLTLPQRYRLLSAHLLLSSREGFGLPTVEAQASGVAVIVLDYCSGAEIVGENRKHGMLIPVDPLYTYSGWGNAIDRFPKRGSVVKALNRLYLDSVYRAKIAQRGMDKARQWTWDMAADQVDKALRGIHG